MNNKNKKSEGRKKTITDKSAFLERLKHQLENFNIVKRLEDEILFNLIMVVLGIQAEINLGSFSSARHKPERCLQTLGVAESEFHEKKERRQRWGVKMKTYTCPFLKVSIMYFRRIFKISPPKL